jgi:hypothetical protein
MDKAEEMKSRSFIERWGDAVVPLFVGCGGIGVAVKIAGPSLVFIVLFIMVSTALTCYGIYEFFRR